MNVDPAWAMCSVWQGAWCEPVTHCRFAQMERR